MKKQKIGKIAGLPGTVFGALAVLPAGNYATGASPVGAAVAGMSADPTEGEVTP